MISLVSAIDRGDRSGQAAPLPLLAVALVLLRQFGLGHDDDRHRRDGLLVLGHVAAHECAIAYRTLSSAIVAAFFRSFSPGGTRRYSVFSSSVAVHHGARIGFQAELLRACVDRRDFADHAVELRSLRVRTGTKQRDTVKRRQQGDTAVASSMTWACGRAI